MFKKIKNFIIVNFLFLICIGIKTNASSSEGIVKALVDTNQIRIGEQFHLELNAIAYPNPFENNFNINVTSNLESSVRIRVYDMLGKLIEDTNVESTEISNYEIGNNYPSGVYNVIVSQGQYYANTRVIKR